jgi:hypothetical protein
MNEREVAVRNDARAINQAFEQLVRNVDDPEELTAWVSAWAEREQWSRKRLGRALVAWKAGLHR